MSPELKALTDRQEAIFQIARSRMPKVWEPNTSYAEIEYLTSEELAEYQEIHLALLKHYIQHENMESARQRVAEKHAAIRSKYSVVTPG